MIENVAIIVAAGSGIRFGGNIPKQYLPLGNKILLDRTIDTFISSSIFTKILVVINNHHKEFYKQSFYYNKVFFIEGGNTRSESVFNAMLSLKNAKVNINAVLIHDAVRPYVTKILIKNVFCKLIKYGIGHGVIPIIQLYDTLREFKNTKFKVLSRDNLYLTQTPQGFFFNDLFLAYSDIGFNKKMEYTDDAMIAESYGIIINSVCGDINNYKITTTTDYQIE